MGPANGPSSASYQGDQHTIQTIQTTQCVCAVLMHELTRCQIRIVRSFFNFKMKADLRWFSRRIPLFFFVLFIFSFHFFRFTSCFTFCVTSCFTSDLLLVYFFCYGLLLFVCLFVLFWFLFQNFFFLTHGRCETDSLWMD